MFKLYDDLSAVFNLNDEEGSKVAQRRLLRPMLTIISADTHLNFFTSGTEPVPGIWFKARIGL